MRRLEALWSRLGKDLTNPCAPVQRRRRPLQPAELEDVEVAAEHVDRDVVDGDGPDRALERAGVRVAVKHEVGSCSAIGAASRSVPRNAWIASGLAPSVSAVGA